MTQSTNGQSNGQLTKMDHLKNMLNASSVQDQFRNALAENAGTFVASVIDLYGGDSYLQNCDPKKVVMEALKAAVLKLPINKSLGFAYIVPYKSGNEHLPQFQIGYKGLIQLAMRTGSYRIINADIVYEGEFRSRNKLTGEFDLGGRKTSDVIIGYFAYIELLNGFSKTLYMTKERVIQHAEKYSKSYKTANGPWTKEFDAMAIKTVLRNLLSHYGFLSVEMVNAFDNDP
jgi:recombination protein RecT